MIPTKRKVFLAGIAGTFKRDNFGDIVEMYELIVAIFMIIKSHKCPCSGLVCMQNVFVLYFAFLS